MEVKNTLGGGIMDSTLRSDQITEFEGLPVISRKHIPDKKYSILKTERSTMIVYDEPDGFQKEMERIHKESIATLRMCPRTYLTQLWLECGNILEYLPSVDEYEKRANNLTEVINQAYEATRKVAGPNCLHAHHKSIDPEIYGRAQTFSKCVRSLLSDVKEALGKTTLTL